MVDRQQRFQPNASVSVKGGRWPWSAPTTTQEWRVIDMHCGSHEYGPDVIAAYTTREGWADPEGSAKRLAAMLNGVAR